MTQAAVSDEALRTTVEAVQAAQGSITQASIALGIPRGTVQSRMLMAKIRGWEFSGKEVSFPEKNHTNIGNDRTQKQTKTKKHCVIPDCQVKPGVPLDHLRWAGEYIADKRPDTIVCLGDFADMPSLSSYDRGKASAECKRYKFDVEAAHKGMELLMSPIVKCEDYHPRLVLTIGNHEDRITRFGDDNPALDGHVSIDDLGYQAWGWEVVPYRQVIKIDGINYAHFFYNPNTGRPLAGANLETRLKTIGMSFTMGHQQGLSIAIRDLADGTRQRGLVAGSFYQHSEDYKGPQGNGHWHGILMKAEVENGNYDLCEVSLGYLKRKYS